MHVPYHAELWSKAIGRVLQLHSAALLQHAVPSHSRRCEGSHAHAPSQGHTKLNSDMIQADSALAALFEGMGGLPVAATGLEAQMIGLDSADTMGDDSALHDLVMFGEDDPAATPDVAPPSEANTTVICPSANGHTDMCASCASEVRGSRA